MSALSKSLLFATVVALLTVLVGCIGVSPLLYPGYLMVKPFVSFPHPFSWSVDDPHWNKVALCSCLWWQALFAAWALIGHARRVARR